MKKILLVGAGNYGKFIIKEFMEDYNYDIVAILDDNIYLKNVWGIDIVGCIGDIDRVLNEIDIDLVILSIANLEDKKREYIVEACEKNNISIKVMPTVENILKNIVKVKEETNSDLSKLLNRPVFDMKSDKIYTLVSNKTVLVTGGGGSIGSEICRQIMLMNPKRLIVLDMYENSTYELKTELDNKFKKQLKNVEVIIMSVLNSTRLKKVFEMYKPEIVFHAAAYKHVPLMERSPVEAIKNNIFGTLNVATLADEFNVDKFVLISTDKAVNPTNIMGASKRFCEMIVTALNSESNTDFIAVRFGNVLGSNGSVIPLFRKQIESGGPVTLTHRDITRYFMLIPEAVNLVLHAATLSSGGEVFILDMGEPIKINDLAKRLIEGYNLRPGIDIAIEEIGLRPGEKLYEELILNKDNVRYTTHNRIFIEECEDIDMKYVHKCIEHLEKVCVDYTSNLELKKELSYIVKSYKFMECV